MTIRRAEGWLLFALVAATGCDVPRFPGPQIQHPPPGFTLQPETSSPRRTFPDRDPSFHTAWVHTSLGGVSVIYIDGHPGVLGAEEVMAARDRATTDEPDEDAVFGEVEALRVDGRNAWGWYERIESARRGLVEVRYRAVIPYDSVTYAIEFVSGEPSIKRASPDTLRDVVSTFAIGRTTYDIPVILVVLGGIVFVVAVLRSRSKEKADRLRSINLVTLRKEGDEERASEPGTSDRPRSPDTLHARGAAPRPEPETPPPPDPTRRDPSSPSG